MSNPIIGDYSPTVKPDLGGVSRRSRIGRKARRKALDTYHRTERGQSGRPAKSGPPVPGSERTGRRTFYTLEQARIGGIRSGATRRFNARERHAKVRQLRAEGLSLRAIALVVGYSAATCSRILNGKIRTCLSRSETVAQTQPQGITRTLTPPPPHEQPGDLETEPILASVTLTKLGMWAIRLEARLAALETGVATHPWSVDTMTTRRAIRAATRHLETYRTRIAGYVGGIRRSARDDGYTLAVVGASGRMAKTLAALPFPDAFRELKVGTLAY